MTQKPDFTDTELRVVRTAVSERHGHDVPSEPAERITTLRRQVQADHGRNSGMTSEQAHD